ncbi:MAG: hypothetical protein AAF557_06180 [Pseudomonadota bacterium]
MELAEIEVGISHQTLVELQAVPIDRGRPLIAVDVDEVLVHFVPHLDRYIRTLGFEMRLVRYELEGSMFPIGSDDPLPFDECIGLINKFFEAETLNQEAVEGGGGALERMAAWAQIVILTNVPRHATAARRQNLNELGMPYPLVVNSGGKGRAMAWMAAKAGAPCGFVDDSVKQLESVAKHVPACCRLHYAGADFIARIFPECEFATEQVRDWAAAEEALKRVLSV